MKREKLEQEFFRLYESEATAIFRFVFFRVSDREAAKDIAQESFLKLWGVWSSGKHIENPRALLYRIASNKVIDRYRKWKEYSLDQLSESGFDAANEESIPIEEKIDTERAVQKLSELPEKYREAVYLRFVEEWSVKDIAVHLGETENTVSVRIHRGLAQWRKRLS